MIHAEHELSVYTNLTQINSEFASGVVLTVTSIPNFRTPSLHFPFPAYLLLLSTMAKKKAETLSVRITKTKSKFQTSGSRKRSAVSAENESSSEEEGTHKKKQKSKRSRHAYDSSDVESAEGNEEVNVVEILDNVEVEAGMDAEEDDVSLHSCNEKINLTNIKGLAKCHHAAILANEKNEDMTQDIKLMFLDLVKVSFNKVDENGDAVQKGKKPVVALRKGRWCLICR
jgi:hypothetical protein